MNNPAYALCSYYPTINKFNAKKFCYCTYRGKHIKSIYFAIKSILNRLEMAFKYFIREKYTLIFYRRKNN